MTLNICVNKISCSSSYKELPAPSNWKGTMQLAVYLKNESQQIRASQHCINYEVLQKQRKTEILTTGQNV